jgi:TQXA domain-containing protein
MRPNKALLAAFLLQVATAGAVPQPVHVAPAAGLRGSGELVWNVLAAGEYGIDGFLPNGAFDPTQGYPPMDPTTGYTPTHEYFAGVIVGEPTDGSPHVSLYCINIRTDTYPGTPYNLGTWDAANVANVGYVSRILNNYYPHVPGAPAGLTDDQRAAAVQMAIWFFSDGFVVDQSNPLHDAVVAIVNDVLKPPPPPDKPTPPSLTLTPPVANAPAGHVAGPFTVNTAFSRRRHGRLVRSSPDATVTAGGGKMYLDSAGTTLLGDGTTDTVPSGTQFWVRADSGFSSVALTATAKAEVPGGNVYLYAGGTNERQKLILADTGTLTTTVDATANFLPPGSLLVKKTIAGPAARAQGQVVIHVDCDDGVARDDFVIDAHAHAGTTSKTYDGIPYGTSCTVNETADGSNHATQVVVKGDGQTVTIASGETETVKITNIYYFVPGSLLVTKTITGPGAGLQGPVTIHTVCNGTALTPDFVIAAGAHAGHWTKQYDRIRAPATCTVTETANGQNSAVSVVVDGSGQRVPIPAGEIARADLGDTYGLSAGQFEVTKAITGPAAGQQGPVVIHTVCNGAPLPDFTIPAGATGNQSFTYSGVPAGNCTVSETTAGATSTVSAVVSGSPQTTTIPPGGTGAAVITDTYGNVPGSLLVTKNIGGPLAGHQGPVRIHVVCNGIPQTPDFVIGARARAGSVSHNFNGIPAGSTCNVSEIAVGATSTVSATVVGGVHSVPVSAGKVVPVSLIDLYEATPGLLRVIKTVAGSDARLHGRITILVSCGGPGNQFVFTIAAHTAAGSVSRYFGGLRAGARCTASEVAVGRAGGLIVIASGSRTVTIRPSALAIARLKDTFIPAPVPSGRG